MLFGPAVLAAPATGRSLGRARTPLSMILALSLPCRRRATHAPTHSHAPFRARVRPVGSRAGRQGAAPLLRGGTPPRHVGGRARQVIAFAADPPRPHTPLLSTKIPADARAAAPPAASTPRAAVVVVVLVVVLVDVVAAIAVGVALVVALVAAAALDDVAAAPMHPPLPPTPPQASRQAGGPPPCPAPARARLGAQNRPMGPVMPACGAGGWW